MPFVDREEELELLEQMWGKRGFQFIPIYGRRRVGKTKLVQEFMRNKKAIYYLADMIAEGEQLKNLGREVGEALGDMILAENGFTDWYQFFRYVEEASKERLLLIIDEFPYLVNSNKAISSIFQKGIDTFLKDSSVMLILLGSSVGMMEEEVLSAKSPLYGRRTGSLEIKPLPARALEEFFPGKDFTYLLSVYSIFGSIPAYLEKVNPKLGIFRNISDLVLKKGSYFHDEVEFLLREELREPRNYFVILRAIAQGKRKLSEIMNDTGFERTMLSRYLDILCDLGIVEKEIPVTERQPHKSRAGLYRIRDRFFNFWFRFVFPQKSKLEIERTDHVLELIKNSFDIYLSEAYEEMANMIFLEWMKKGLVKFTRIGRWWRKNEEIDLVAIDEDENTMYLCECKWSNKKVGTDIYEDLKRKGNLVQWKSEKVNKRYVLFSKSGFTHQMVGVAKSEGVILVEKDKVILGL